MSRQFCVSRFAFCVLRLPAGRQVLRLAFLDSSRSVVRRPWSVVFLVVRGPSSVVFLVVCGPWSVVCTNRAPAGIQHPASEILNLKS